MNNICFLCKKEEGPPRVVVGRLICEPCANRVKTDNRLNGNKNAKASRNRKGNK